MFFILGKIRTFNSLNHLEVNNTMSVLVNENIQLSELPNCTNDYYINWDKTEIDDICNHNGCNSKNMNQSNYESTYVCENQPHFTNLYMNNPYLHVSHSLEDVQSLMDFIRYVSPRLDDSLCF